MDLHDSGKFKLRRHPSGGGSKGVENSRDYARPFRFVLAVVVNCCGYSTSIRASSPASWANVFTIKRRDRLKLINYLGALILAQYSPDGYKEISQARVIKPTQRVWERLLTWSHPAFANKCVYHRNYKEIMCIPLAAA